VARLRKLREFRKMSDAELSAQAAEVQHRHCLGVIAMELGFPNWPAAKKALEGGAVSEFGTLLWTTRCGQHLNHWCKTYEEAAAIRASRGGYLLAYGHQYFVVDRYYFESLRLNPDDADWQEIGFDWARPANPDARTRLYGKLIAQLPREAA
jgi:hypothetical protein